MPIQIVTDPLDSVPDRRVPPDRLLDGIQSGAVIDAGNEAGQTRLKTHTVDTGVGDKAIARLGGQAPTDHDAGLGPVLHYGLAVMSRGQQPPVSLFIMAYQTVQFDRPCRQPLPPTAPVGRSEYHPNHR